MSSVNVATRLLFLSLALAAVLPLAAQPVVDGTVNVGEYTYSSGDWRMSWDATHLYVAKVNVAVSNGLALHLDIDPRSTPTAGSAANGNLATAGMNYGAATDPYSPRLPFRADVRVVAGADGTNLSIRDGSGSWTNGDQSDLTVGTGSTAVEFSVRWDGMPGLTARPASFNWAGHQINAAAMMVQGSNPMPAANTANGSRIEYFFHVASTDSPTDPFTDQRSTWVVTSNADSGAYTLRSSIDSANNDTASSRRYITFDVGTTTISITTALSLITRTTTIDGSSQSGYAGTPLITINGPGANQTVDGFNTFNATSCEIRGFNFSNLARAIVIGNGSHDNTIAANHIGLAGANLTGIQVSSANNTTIGGTTDADRNVISGNTTGINLYATMDVQILRNYIGTGANGLTAVPNFNGIEITNDTDTMVGGAGNGNVISGNDNDAINIAGNSDPFILGNLIGVAADGTTALGNDGDGIDGAAGQHLTIGSLGAGNVIANNAGIGIRATGGGLLIRHNSVHSNGTNISLTNAQAAPTVHQASSGDGSTLGLKLSFTASNLTAPTQSFQFDLYRNDNGPKTLVATSVCYEQTFLSNETWNVGSGFAPGDSLILMATAYQATGCTTPGDGTSVPTAAFTVDNGTATTTALTFSDANPWVGETVTMTATVTGTGTPSGTVTFRENGQVVGNCQNLPLSGGSAPCFAQYNATGAHTIDVEYSGDSFNDGSTDSESLTVKLHVFTGSGDFNNPANWNDNEVPAASESFRIEGTCTFPNFSSPAYGAMEIAAGGTMQWLSNHTNTLIVRDITGSGTINMTAGGRLSISGSFASTINFVRGAGTVTVFAGVALPPFEFNHLNISIGTVTGTTLTVHGNLSVGANATLTTTGTLTMRGSTLTNSGTFSPSVLSIPTGVTVSASGSITPGQLDVDGTFTPGASNVIGGTSLTGDGKIVVTSVTTPDSFGSQYTAASKTLTALTVEFNGAAAQSIDALQYNNLILNNTNGASMATGTATVSGVLTLQQGVLQTSNDGTANLDVDNTAPAAVVYSNGWISGRGFRRKIAAGTGAYSYPLGFTSARIPVTVTYYNVAAPEFASLSLWTPAEVGIVTAGTGLDPARDANVFFRISNTTSSKFDFAIDYSTPGLIDIAAMPQYFVFRSRHLINGNDTWVHTAANASAGGLTVLNVSRQNTSMVWFTVGNQLADATKSEITTASNYLVSNGTSSTTVTVQLRDALNVNLNVGGDAVTLATNLGTLSAVTDAWNGTYTATLTAGNTAGTATITGTVNTVAITDNATVTFGPLGTPSNLTAAASSTTSIVLTWTAASGATSYAIERRSTGTGFVQIATSNTNAFTDTTVSATTAHLYRVRALAGTTSSDNSNVDLATTVIFTDPGLAIGTTIKAAHFTELRSAVNALRGLAGLSGFNFTAPAPAAGGTFRKSHLEELRSNLASARSSLALPAITFTDSTITTGVTKVKAVHLTELRGGVQ